MATQPTPITALPSKRDPLRNFKFRATFLSTSSHIGSNDIWNDNNGPKAGFISINGLGITHDMIPYREGGDNTTTRKMPGQSDVGPLTFVRGVFMDNLDPGYEWSKQIFAIQWGQGNEGFDEDFRYNIRIDVLKHPVTKFSAGAQGDPSSPASAGMSFMVYNAWIGSLVYNDLNAGDNSIMISNMTVYHEGFDARFGANSQVTDFAPLPVG